MLKRPFIYSMVVIVIVTGFETRGGESSQEMKSDLGGVKVSEIEAFQWKHRLLVMDCLKPTFCDDQLTQFRAHPNENQERKLKLMKIKNHTGGQSLFQSDLSQSNPFQMVLMGLDGSIKQRFLKPTPMTSIYQVIDLMPMRRRELSPKPGSF